MQSTASERNMESVEAFRWFRKSCGRNCSFIALPTTNDEDGDDDGDGTVRFGSNRYRAVGMIPGQVGAMVSGL